MRVITHVFAIITAVSFWGTTAHGDLIHQWTFNDVNDGYGGLGDSVGSAHGGFLTLSPPIPNTGGPQHSLFSSASPNINVDGQLVLNGSGYVSTSAPAQTLTNKTILAWVTMTTADTMHNNPAAAGVLSVHTGGMSGGAFDAIVYGERTGDQWQNGSNTWSRTPVDNFGAAETSTEEIMIAITYSASEITLYRNGQPYANGGSFAAVNLANPNFLIGMRGFHLNGIYGLFSGSINEARVYNTALGEADILAIYNAGPVPIPEPTSFAAASLGMLGLFQLIRRRRRTVVD